MTAYDFLDGESDATVQTHEEAVSAYVATALWSSPTFDESDRGPEFLDGVDAEISDVTRNAMARDVWEFLSAAWSADLNLSSMDPEQIGHDFWLTRNHHGAGFWDRALDELGDTLTTLAHSFGEVFLYVGDDGQIHHE